MKFMNTHIDLNDKDYDVSTYGGSGRIDDFVHDSYGIQIDTLSFEITGKTAVELVKKLKEHLEVNGIKHE